MKAAHIYAYGDPDVFRVEDAPEPLPGPRDLLVRVRASSVNPVDCKTRVGSQRAINRKRMPAILGLDVSGEVCAVGAEVTRFEVGDSIYASPNHRRPGTYAEYVAIDEREAAKKPANLTHEEAASIPLVGLTVYNALVTGTALKEGETVLVQGGSGGVGTFAVQYARHLGARVVATCSARNVELVTSLGAHQVVDYTETAFEDVLQEVDVVLDAVGGDVERRSLQVLRRGGRMSTLASGLPGFSKRYGPYLGFAVTVASLARRIAAARLRGVRQHMALRRADGEELATLTPLLEQGVVRPVVDRVLPLADIAEAHRYIETGRARGKVVISVAEA